MRRSGLRKERLDGGGGFMGEDDDGMCAVRPRRGGVTVRGENLRRNSRRRCVCEFFFAGAEEVNERAVRQHKALQAHRMPGHIVLLAALSPQRVQRRWKRSGARS